MLMHRARSRARAGFGLGGVLLTVLALVAGLIAAGVTAGEAAAANPSASPTATPKPKPKPTPTPTSGIPMPKPQPTPKPEKVADKDKAPPGSPDVVIIVADDLRKGLAEPVLRNVSRYVSSKGSVFTNAVVTTPHCCPSRSMIMTGQYAHHSGIWDNGEVAGGWWPFRSKGLEKATLALALQRRGYRTGLFGKYLNGYTRIGPKPKPIPPGWNVFETFIGIGPTGAYGGYGLSGVGAFGTKPKDYSTDVLARRASKFIRGAKKNEPLFVMMTPYAPHSPSEPPARYAVSPTASVPLPKALRSAEGKPAWVQAARASRKEAFFTKLDRRRARERATMRAFDDAVGQVAEALQARGTLRNTIFIITSDNGYLHGDYGLAGKNLPYRAVTDVPLYVAWPAGGVPRGKDRRLTTMVDIPESVAAATGAKMPKAEGVNFLRPQDGLNTRFGVMLEGTSTDPARPAYCGFRTLEFRYARYSDGSEELYELRGDPNELRNVVDDPWYANVAAVMRDSAKRTCVPTAPGFSWNKVKPTNRRAILRDESATEE